MAFTSHRQRLYWKEPGDGRVVLRPQNTLLFFTREVDKRIKTVMLEKIQGISGESLKCQVCCCGHFLTVSHSDHAYVAGIMKQIAPFFKVHLSICCSDAPVACICPSCGCLQKDSFHLTVATQLHTKCKHNNLCNLCYLMPNKHANQCIFIFLSQHEGWKVLRVVQCDGCLISLFFSFLLSCLVCLALLALLLASLLCLAMHVKSVPSLFQSWAHSQAPPFKT